ncbi:hypothetical protein K7H22_11495 [Seohaeicola saemankumensis]|nr:hypothetical protein [Seohaeicola saemankumensis]MCD1626614.1 hypothetical protein [Seohaeicola saemankumensis]
MAKKSKKAVEKAEKPPEAPQRAVKVPVALRFNADLLTNIDKVAACRAMR